jgi:hypothetical protein
MVQVIVMTWVKIYSMTSVLFCFVLVFFNLFLFFIQTLNSKTREITEGPKREGEKWGWFFLLQNGMEEGGARSR